MENNGYLAPAGFGEAEYVERHSRFLGKVWKIKTEQEALEHLKACRETYWDASHNVYCYRVKSGSIMRYSDDGEPGGTAGLPAINVFLKEGIQDFCCVITRYFGGILLGAGGLARAYSHTAKLSLKAAGLAEARLWRELLIGCPYGLYERIRRGLEERGAVTENVDFASDVLMAVLVPSDETEDICARITDLAAGNTVIQTGEEVFRFIRKTE